jgi:biotin carboxyl carrier protein
MKKQFRITLNGKSYDVVAEVIGGDDGAQAAPAATGTRPARSASAVAVTPEAAPRAAPAGGSGDIPSPLAGKVVSIDVAVGAQVQPGQKVLTLEAMKMNTVVSAPAGGTVKAILVSAGDPVEEGQPLLTIQ